MDSNADPLVAFLVEDSEIIRENLIVAMADIAGARVIAYAESEMEAASWLRQHATDWQIAVIDMFLKDGSGLGVLRLCQQRLPTQRVVVLTNYATPDIRERCSTLGADAVFDKSTELDDFLAYCAA